MDLTIQTHAMSITPNSNCAAPSATQGCHGCDTQKHAPDSRDESAATGGEEEEGGRRVMGEELHSPLNKVKETAPQVSLMRR